MVWEHRLSVVVVLGEGEEELLPKKGGEEHRHSLVVSRSWVPSSLCVRVRSERVGGGGVEGLVVRVVELESLVDRETDHVQLFQYSRWPQHGEGVGGGGGCVWVCVGGGGVNECMCV